MIRRAEPFQVGEFAVAMASIRLVHENWRDIASVSIFGATAGVGLSVEREIDAGVAWIRAEHPICAPKGAEAAVSSACGHASPRDRLIDPAVCSV